MQDQKRHSASSVQNWWLERLLDGHTKSDGNAWLANVRVDSLYEDYCDVSQKIGVKRRVSNMAFGKELKNLVPGLERRRIQKEKHRYWAYLIPDLETCQNNFDLITRSQHDWPLDDWLVSYFLPGHDLYLGQRKDRSSAARPSCPKWPKENDLVTHLLIPAQGHSNWVR